MMSFQHTCFRRGRSPHRAQVYNSHGCVGVLMGLLLALSGCGKSEGDSDEVPPSPASSQVAHLPREAVPQDVGPAIVGMSVGDFELTGTDGETSSLEQIALGQPLVLAWYQSAGTRGCEMECRTIDRISSRLSGAGVSVAAVSMDPFGVNAEFAQSMGVGITLWSDPGGRTATAMGVVHPSGRFPLRWTYYIDAEGVVRHVDRDVDPGQAHFAIFEQLGHLGWSNVNLPTGNQTR